MSARPFPPLWLTLPGREPRRIDNAFDALECLMTAWPSAKFRSHRRAVRACRDALDGFISAERARRMLLEAAIDVDLAIDCTAPERTLAKESPLPLKKMRDESLTYGPVAARMTTTTTPRPLRS